MARFSQGNVSGSGAEEAGCSRGFVAQVREGDRMTEPTNSPEPPRRRGRPCKEPPWLKDVAAKVASGSSLRRALLSMGIYLDEREVKSLYRLKKFRQYKSAAIVEFYREWGRVPRRRRVSSTMVLAEPSL